MHYCPTPQGRGQLFIELSTAPRGIVLTILLNRHEITVYYTTEPETNNALLAIDCLIGARRRKPVTSHGIFVTLNVIGHGIVKNYNILFFHYIYMGDVTGMV